jgi:hypothetical protein
MVYQISDIDKLIECVWFGEDNIVSHAIMGIFTKEWANIVYHRVVHKGTRILFNYYS